MEACNENTLDCLNESTRFVIHTYQRSFSRIERTCRQCWNDVMRTGWNDLIPVYFVGSTVYDESARHPLLLVINQQRYLITVMQLPAAVATVVKGKVPANRYSSSTMKKYDLINPEEVGRRFNLSSDEGRSVGLAIAVEQNTQPTNPSLRVTWNVGPFGKPVAKRG